MIKISSKMAEFSQLAENLEPWECSFITGGGGWVEKWGVYGKY